MQNNIKICFMGSPQFAVPSLYKLNNSNFDIKAVFTQEPKPSHRGKKIYKLPIHIEAENLGITVYCPKTIRSEEIYNYLKSLNLDFIVVVAYGQILPKSILDIPKFGCINLHASLLPRWRGAAPIHRAIMEGDKTTGISIMLMTEGLDSGPVLSYSKVNILEEHNITNLSDILAIEGAEILAETISDYYKGTITPIAQKKIGIKYADKIGKIDQIIDWDKDAKKVLRQINALSPLPGAKCKIRNEIIKIVSAEVINYKHKDITGLVVSDDFTVKCKQDAIRILSLQRPGKKIMSTKEVLNGWKIEKGYNMQKIIL